ncbi:MAG: prepilin-type N-terminal cleavage/methylation domain-containing protein [Methylovulum sp.]
MVYSIPPVLTPTTTRVLAKQTGFTLIEVLIAMSLLSIMVILLFASLRICAVSWEKGEQKIADVNEIAVVYQFFQRQLAVTKPVWDEFNYQDDRRFAFAGGHEYLKFVSEFPASSARAGLQLFSIELENNPENRQSWIVHANVVPFYKLVQESTNDISSVVLIKHIKSLQFFYLGDTVEGENALWQDEWLGQETLPKLIKIELQRDDGVYWPPMIIALKIAGAEDGSVYGGGVVEDNPEEDNLDAVSDDVSEEDPDLVEQEDN